MKIIVAGGTGMVGSILVDKLLELQHEVIILSRRDQESSTAGLTFSRWNPSEAEVDEKLIKSADAIINLSGASIAQRWTDVAKKEIMESRTLSTALLSRVAVSEGSNIHTFINASAIGYYQPGQEPKSEDEPPGDHFMAKVCKSWEDSVMIPDQSEVRKVILRIGVVLEANGGALKAMSIPFKLGLGAALGNGKQFMSIIHIDDLINAMIFLLNEKSTEGAYNLVMPNIPTNKTFSRTLAKAMNRPFFLPPVPAFVLRIFLGETAESVLQSFNVSSKKLEKAGFQFEYSDTQTALHDIYNSHDKR